MEKEALVEELSKLSVLEMADLKTALEDKWGVKAAAAAVAVAAPAADAGEAAPEATDFEITLTGFDASKKIAIIKVVREITGLGLKEAKEVVESAPATLKEAVAKGEAEELQKTLEEAGASIELK